MNKSKIDWCDFTWNPVTGCRHTCEYCYARKIANRFCGNTAENLKSDQIQITNPYDRKLYTLPSPFKNQDGRTLPFPAGFEPTLHEYRLQKPVQKKKAANIFVCSMADLFGYWVPTEWILKVFEACEAAPWHNYLFLTKTPSRYVDLEKAGKLPLNENFWYGVTATNAEQMKDAASAMDKLPRYNKFLSAEPLNCDLTETVGWTMSNFGSCFQWIIIGAETGNRAGKVTPQWKWIRNIVNDCNPVVPILMKDSREIRSTCGDHLIQRFPDSLYKTKEEDFLND